MAGPPVERFEPCIFCRQEPMVERRTVGRRSQYHLEPCCPDVRDLLTKELPHRGQFYLDKTQGPASRHIAPDRSRAKVINSWNELMRASMAGS